MLSQWVSLGKPGAKYRCQPKSVIYPTLTEDMHIHSTWTILHKKYIYFFSRTHIDSLHRENGEIDIDLALAKSQRNVNMDKDNTKEIKYLLQTLRQYQKEVTNELKASNQLDYEVRVDMFLIIKTSLLYDLKLCCL